MVLFGVVVVGIIIYILLNATGSLENKAHMANTNNDAYTNFQLAEKYNSEKNKDSKRVFELYSLASMQGHKEAKCRLAGMYCLGEAVPVDYDKSFEIFLSLCNSEKSEVPQQNILAFFQYYVEHKLSSSNVNIFVESLIIRANLDSLFCQFLLGEMYFNGIKVEKNIEQSLYWYLKAADNTKDLDCGTSSYNLRNEAQYILANYYRNLDETDENYKLSAFWYVEALNSYHQAAYNLLLGVTEPKSLFFDTELQHIMFLKHLYQSLMTRAEQNVSESQKMLSSMYSYGVYPKQDYTKSLFWLEKAAEQGNQEANYLVGTRYEDGFGTEKNIQKAIFWYKRAPNYFPALTRLDELAKNRA